MVDLYYKPEAGSNLTVTVDGKVYRFPISYSLSLDNSPSEVIFLDSRKTVKKIGLLKALLKLKAFHNLSVKPNLFEQGMSFEDLSLYLDLVNPDKMREALSLKNGKVLSNSVVLSSDILFDEAEIEGKLFSVVEYKEGEIGWSIPKAFPRVFIEDFTRVEPLLFLEPFTREMPLLFFDDFQWFSSIYLELFEWYQSIYLESFQWFQSIFIENLEWYQSVFIEYFGVPHEIFLENFSWLFMIFEENYSWLQPVFSENFTFLSSVFQEFFAFYQSVFQEGYDAFYQTVFLETYPPTEFQLIFGDTFEPWSYEIMFQESFEPQPYELVLEDDFDIIERFQNVFTDSFNIGEWPEFAPMKHIILYEQGSGTDIYLKERLKG